MDRFFKKAQRKALGYKFILMSYIPILFYGLNLRASHSQKLECSKMFLLRSQGWESCSNAFFFSAI